MESVLKSDVFFFITTISVLVVTSFLIIALYYFVKILRNFYKISKVLRTYTEDVDASFRDIGEQIRRSPLFNFFFKKEKAERKESVRVKKV